MMETKKHLIVQKYKEFLQVLNKLDYSDNNLYRLDEDEMKRLARVFADSALVDNSGVPRSIVNELEKRNIKPKDFMH